MMNIKKMNCIWALILMVCMSLTANASIISKRTIDGMLSCSPSITIQITPTESVNAYAVEEVLYQTMIPSSISHQGEWDKQNRTIRWGTFIDKTPRSLTYDLAGPDGSYSVCGTVSADGFDSKVSGESWVRFYCMTYSRLARTIQNNSSCQPEIQLQIIPYAPSSTLAIEETLAKGSIPLNISEDGIWDYHSHKIRWGTFTENKPQIFTYQIMGEEGSYQVDGIASFDGRKASFSGDSQVSIVCPPYENLLRIISNNYTCLPQISISVKAANSAEAWAVEETIPFGLKPVHMSDNGIWDSENNVLRWGTFYDHDVHTFTYAVMGSTGNYELSGVLSLNGKDYLIPGTTGASIFCNSAKVEKPVFDPPDLTPVPIKVSISCPTPGAEIRYTIDGTTPNINSMLYVHPIELRNETTIKAKAYSIAMAESNTAEAVYPELPYVKATHRTTDTMVSCSPQVTIEIDPNIVVDAYSVEEFFPDSIIPININENGVWDETNKRIKWGTFLDHSKRTLSYEVIGNEGVYAVSGLISVNGNNFEIMGRNRIEINQCISSKQLERMIANNLSCTPEISIIVSPSADIITYAIYEELPEGILPVNITEGGRWDAEMRRIRWGTFLDRNARHLSYEIVGKIGSYPISGQASFDGSNQSIPGDFSAGIQGEACSFDESKPGVLISKEPDTDYSNDQYIITIEAERGEITYRLDSGQWLNYEKALVVGTDGSHTVEAQTADITGIVGMATPVSFYIDKTPPINCSIQIDNNAKWTGTPSVTLTLSAIDAGIDMGQMKFSNDAENWSEPVDYARIYNWFLNSGNGLRQVYAQFSDALGNWTSSEIVDDIYLSGDNQPPDPTGLQVERIDHNSVVLHWDHLLEPFGMTYHVYRSEFKNGIFYQVNTMPIDILSMLGKDHFTDNYINEGKIYYYKIRAFLNGIPSENYSETIEVFTRQDQRFILSVEPDSHLIKISDTAIYSIHIERKDDFYGNILSNCIGLSDGLNHNFYLNGKYMGKSLVAKQGDLVLKIKAGSAADIKEHRFLLRSTNTETGFQQDYPLVLTVVREDNGGIHVVVEKQLIHKGEIVFIYGTIIPRTSNSKITLNLQKQDNSGDVLTKKINCNAFGEFMDKDWIATLDIGDYELVAHWTDDQGNVHVSAARTFRIIKGKSIVSCMRELHLIPKTGNDYTIHGAMFPVVASPLITLRVFDPLGNYEDVICEQNNNGEYAKTQKFFKQKGIYKFKAYWPGNETYIGCESDTLVVPVDVDNGRAIILGGGYAEMQNLLWKTTLNICTLAYRQFKKKKYQDDEICLLLHSESIDYNYDYIPDPVVDVTTPTVEKFIDVIKNEYIDVVSEDIPLFILMQGHGTSDGRFKVLGNDEYIHADEINAALDYIQEQTNCTIILILESCYSGNFIQTLSGLKRVILTSTGNNEYSTDYQGKLSFSYYFFNKLQKGSSIYKSFEFARSSLIQMGYSSPQLEDNADGIPNTEHDGALASNLYLHGELWPGGDPEVSQITLTVLAPQKSIQIDASVFKGEHDISRVWAHAISPGTDITETETGIALPECELNYSPTTGLYRGVLSDLTLLGEYKIMVIAEDINHNLSEVFIAHTTLREPSLPGDVNNDQQIDLLDLILLLRHLGKF